MRILQVTSHLNVGGVTSYVLSLSRALVARGHQVAVASGDGELAAQARAWGIPHWPVPLDTSVEFSPQVFAATRTLAQRMTQEAVECLHAHTRVSQVVADRLARRHRVPYVTTWHGFFRRNLGRRLWSCTGDATIAISEPVRQHLLADFRVAAERVRLIPHGIDAAPFVTPVDAGVKQELRQRLGIPAAARIVGTIARLVPSKGVEQLVRGFATVRGAVPEAHLVIVGDGTARGTLQALARAQGLADAVRFSGTLPETRVALSIMEVFVFLPADEEGFGLSLLEAMAAGRPIVAVRRGRGAPWVLKESGVGTVVEPEDPAGLGEAVIRLLRDGSPARRMGEEARAVVTRRYTISRMADQVEALYRELVVGASTGRP